VRNEGIREERRVIRREKERERRYKKSKGGKAIPLQAWAGPELSSRLRLPDFKTVGT
jgi:hypothetical protein